MSREAFEKWARTEEFDVFHDGAEYVDHSTNCARVGWQARQPEIDALQAEVMRLRESGIKIIQDHTERTKEAIALQTEVERLRKDAERYQCLRSRVSNPYVAETTEFGVMHIYGDRLDAAIDAAMKGPK